MKPTNLFPNLKVWKEVRLTDHLDLFQKDKPCDWQNELENIYDANIYGGFLEDRSPLFDERHDKNSPIHVGVDFWIKEYNPVFCTIYNGKVLYKGKTDNCRGGWGYRVDILDIDENKVFIYGHLGGLVPNFKIGYNISLCELIGQVGLREENGGWRPHLHLQVVDYKFYSSFGNPRNIDAYMPNDPEILRHFSNPIDNFVK